MAIGNFIGPLFNMIMAAYGGGGAGGATTGFGSAPSGVEGPSMANGGFYSQPQGIMGAIPQSVGGGSNTGSLGGMIGGAIGSYGGQGGSALGGKIGSLAGDMLSQSSQHAPLPLAPPAQKKPLSQVSRSQLDLQRMVDSLPPELRDSFSKSFGLY